MDIEKLTKEDRMFIETLPEHLGGIQLRKALRIIDAHESVSQRRESRLAAANALLERVRCQQNPSYVLLSDISAHLDGQVRG